MSGPVEGEGGDVHVRLSLHNLSQAESTARIGRMADGREVAEIMLEGAPNLDLEGIRADCHLTKCGLEVAKAIREGSYTPSDKSGRLPASYAPMRSWLITLKKIKDEVDATAKDIGTVSFEKVAVAMANGSSLDVEDEGTLSLSDAEIKELMSFSEEGISLVMSSLEAQEQDADEMRTDLQRDIDRTGVMEDDFAAQKQAIERHKILNELVHKNPSELTATEKTWVKALN